MTIPTSSSRCPLCADALDACAGCRVGLPAATVPGDGFHTWQSQARQYPKKGPAGFSLESHVVAAGRSATVAIDPRDNRVKRAMVTTHVAVDCLLYRNRKGDLVAVLNHYPEDCYEVNGVLLERAGNVNLWVRPNRRHRGIGQRMLAEAAERWSVDWYVQHFTVAGRALVGRYLERKVTL